MTTMRLPKCCTVFWDNGGQWVVAHWETWETCSHAKSGGRGGHLDGTPCNRAIGHGATKGEAIADALEYFG